MWGPIWQGYDCPRGITQEYIPGICREMCLGPEAGICRTGMLQVCALPNAGLKNSKILNQPNAKDAADLISSDGDEKHSRMATARSL